ncbi:MAG: hypothetical protein ACR2MP_19505 [Streptosporangiaceae bacterium]
MPPTAVPCAATWTPRIRLPPAAVTVMGACGLTPELPPDTEMAGGALRPSGRAALPDGWAPPPE